MRAGIQPASDMLSCHSDEFRLIESVRRRQPADDRVRVGIGDDAAVLTDGTLVATDTLLEGRHFTESADPRLIGRKSLAVNLSDIAAMGGTAAAATVALTLPAGSNGLSWGVAVMAGIQDAAAEFGVSIVGGDTTSWDGPAAISVTVLGRVPPGGAVLRSGGRAGDRLYVTGPLGGSLSGRHLTFAPRFKEAAALLAFHPTAMIDVSDGLASDVRHLAEASGCGATLEAERIPVHPDAAGFDAALTDGEDFELLFAISQDHSVALERGPVRVWPVGRLDTAPGLRIRRGGEVEPLTATGFSHTFG